MRFMLLIYTNEADRPAWGTPKGDAEAKAYEELTGEMRQHGLQSGEALQRVAEAKSVRVRSGRVQVTDGPAVQTPEQLGGYYLVDVKDLDEAVQLAAKVPGATYGALEVRPVLEFS
ncbi:MAG TPA: YciI family protein [Actinomycetes bacterium]|nr:YciI family protein [Actinomycetes bacterium]